MLDYSLEPPLTSRFLFAATECVASYVLESPHSDPSDLLPLAVFDNYVAEIRLDEKPIQLALWDTAYVMSLIWRTIWSSNFLVRTLSGQEEYEVSPRGVPLRPMLTTIDTSV